MTETEWLTSTDPQAMLRYVTDDKHPPYIGSDRAFKEIDMAKKKPKILVEEVREGKYVRCWKEGRNFVVQVWKKKVPVGEPDGDWEMPGVLGLSASIGQALAQTT